MTATLAGGRRGGKALALAALAEVAQALARHGALGGVPEVGEEDGQAVLTLRLHSRDTADELEGLELRHALEEVADVAQVRGFCVRYGLDAAALDALVRHVRPAADAPLWLGLTKEEAEALSRVLRAGCNLETGFIPNDINLRRPLTLGVLPKLEALLPETDGDDDDAAK